MISVANKKKKKEAKIRQKNLHSTDLQTVCIWKKSPVCLWCLEEAYVITAGYRNVEL